MTARAWARAAAGLVLGIGLALSAPGLAVSPSPPATASPAPSASVSPSPTPSPPATGSPSASVTASPSGSPSAPADARPDIVLLLIDDLAQIDDRIWERLPTIHRLFLESGIRFTDMIGNDPLCCPGRANLLTGQWAEHHGVILNNGRLFDPRETIATELQSAGYWTGIFGKYFNQTLRIKQKWPPGWSHAFIFGGNYWNYPAWENGRRADFGGTDADYSTTVVQGRVLEALRAAPAEAPRFVWLAPFAVHGGWDQGREERTIQPRPAPEDVGSPACADLAPWSTPAHYEFDITDKPAYLWNRPIVRSWDLTRVCETLLSADRLLAATLEELHAQGRPDPLVILTADNGMTWGAHRWLVKYVPYATPVPLFIRWPGVLGDAPATVHTTVTNVDIAPTLCAIAGCTMGPFPNRFGVDGIDLLPLLQQIGAANLGAAPSEIRTLPDGVTRAADGTIGGLRTGREVVFTEHLTPDGARGMRPWRGLWTTDEAPIGRWVYTVYAGGDVELYDVSGGPCWTWRPGDPGDPCQLTNRADDPSLSGVRRVLAVTLRDRARQPLMFVAAE